jgi:hypothetical protein
MFTYAVVLILGVLCSVHRAYIPELGLSNKPAVQMSQDEVVEMEARGVEGLTWETCPLEGQLADYTIWPG